MIPKEIIELAIAGGWMAKEITELKEKYPTFTVIVHITEWGGMEYLDGSFGQKPLSIIALDPSFWQALGKSCGWPKLGIATGWTWDKNAHRFYDLILTNQPTDTFWQEIINANK